MKSIITNEIVSSGGWISFERFMHLALYTPQIGYYASDSPKLGLMPESGSDFVTAPELSPVFGHVLAAQVKEALENTQCSEIWEFGAGSGALAEQVLDRLNALGVAIKNYTIVDVSTALRQRQKERLARFGDIVRWESSLPEKMQGVVLGNEVLDAMPVQLLARIGGEWHERGVAVRNSEFIWEDRPTSARPPLDVAGEHDYITEIHPQAEAFIRTLGEHLERGAVFFIDYGFGEREFYHPQRDMGTLACHRLHRMDDKPLEDVGSKDITAHINFTGIALSAQEAGLELLGYTSQGNFLLNCGLPQEMEHLDLPRRAMASKLLMEHEMGELFKVIGFVKGAQAWAALCFSHGERSRSL